jgi:hypothetical protein
MTKRTYQEPPLSEELHFSAQVLIDERHCVRRHYPSALHVRLVEERLGG